MTQLMSVGMIVGIPVSTVYIYIQSVEPYSGDEREDVPQEWSRRRSWDTHSLEHLERLISPPAQRVHTYWFVCIV